MNSDKYLLFAGENNEPEIFHTIEGEGEFIGQPSVFLRMFGCNLRCPGFISEDSPNGCDSFISWSVKNKVSFEDTLQLLEDKEYARHLKNGAILKYTGGEPFLRQGKLLEFTEAFIERFGFTPRIDFETNATFEPHADWVNKYSATFTTSPKLANNGEPEEKRYKPDVLKWHQEHGSGFKFVVSQSEDLDEIWKKYVEPFEISRDRIWLMPCCGSRKEHIENAEAVAEYAKQLGVNFSPRLHLLLWDKALRV